MKYKIFYENQFINISRRSSLNQSRYFLFDVYSSKLTNLLVKRGNKKRALRILLNSFVTLKKLTLLSPIFFFRKAVANAFSLFTVRNIIKGRKIFYNIVMLKPQSQIRKSINLIFQLAKQLKRQNENWSFSFSLAIAILNCFFKKGILFKDLKKTHRSLIKRKKKIVRLDAANRIRFRRTKKTKGFYYSRQYGLYKRLTPLY